MECVACNEVVPTDFDTCPHCQKPDSPETASSELARPDAAQTSEASSSAMTDNSNAMPEVAQSANSSTLIEFPGVNRNRPAWRKELSERFREIQQRRAREAALEAEEAFQSQTPLSEAEIPNGADAFSKNPENTKQLGLVPPPNEPEINPIIAAALERVERARAHSVAKSTTHSGSGRTHAATAAARVIAEQPEQREETSNAPSPSKRQSKRADKSEASGDQTRTSTLVVVPAKQIAKPEPPPSVEVTTTAVPEVPAFTAKTTTVVETIEAPPVLEIQTTPVSVLAQPSAIAQTPAIEQTHAEAPKTQPRHLSGVIDEFWLERQGIELLPKVTAPEADVEDRSQRTKRLAAGIVDIVAVAFLSAPFAALIELTIGNWNDPRVSGSMAGIVAVVMFLYNTCSIALAGRTWGMSFCSLHTLNAKTASAPTTGQCVRRSLFYMLSLATFGLGLIYSLFDAEGRTVHDLLSGTIVVKK